MRSTITEPTNYVPYNGCYGYFVFALFVCFCRSRRVKTDLIQYFIYAQFKDERYVYKKRAFVKAFRGFCRFQFTSSIEPRLTLAFSFS